jgi:hypothetical protein
MTEAATLQTEDLTETRFKVLLFFLRTAGIPVHSSKMISLPHALYNVVAIISLHGLYLQFLMGLITSRDLERAVMSFRFFLGGSVTVWMHSCLR